MSYKEQLEVAKANNLSIIDLQVANEVESVFEDATKPYDFEEVCSTVCWVYLGTEDLSVCQIAKAILFLNEKNNEWKGFDKWQIADTASSMF